jgi:hypothetical protein
MQDKSRQDRIFARLMGAADAAVVAFQEDSKIIHPMPFEWSHAA